MGVSGVPIGSTRDTALGVLCADRGLSLSEVARRLNVDPSIVSLWAHRTRRIASGRIDRVCEVLEVPRGMLALVARVAPAPELAWDSEDEPSEDLAPPPRRFVPVGLRRFVPIAQAWAAVPETALATQPPPAPTPRTTHDWGTTWEELALCHLCGQYEPRQRVGEPCPRCIGGRLLADSVRRARRAETAGVRAYAIEPRVRPWSAYG